MAANAPWLQGRAATIPRQSAFVAGRPAATIAARLRLKPQPFEGRAFDRRRPAPRSHVAAVERAYGALERTRTSTVLPTGT